MLNTKPFPNAKFFEAQNVMYQSSQRWSVTNAKSKQILNKKKIPRIMCRFITIEKLISKSFYTDKIRRQSLNRVDQILFLRVQRRFYDQKS